jgi:phage gp36-like protein
MAYATTAQLYTAFGQKNVRAWADLDNEEVDADIDARIAAALADAETTVDDRLRGGPYEVPFTTVPTQVRRATVLLAGVLLYESRGVKDFNEETGQQQHQLSFQKKEAEGLLEDIRRGRLRLNVATEVVRYPQVVANERDDDELFPATS